MENNCQLIAVNPGSTSTKLAVFDGDALRFSVNIKHSALDLAVFPEIADQLAYRKNTILEELKRRNVELEKTSAFIGRCTGLLPMQGGVYEVNELMYEHGSFGPGSKHPGNLGPMIAMDFAKEFGGRAFCVNPSSVDEFIPEARMTGFVDMFRTSRGHPLNQKEVSIRYAKDIGKDYKELNLVVVHMGGGISITAHQKGKMIDSVDSTRGEGRMAPTRSGALPAANLVELCFSGKYTKKELLDRIMKKGGWTEHIGTADAIEVEDLIAKGDKYAELVYKTTAYQIAKDIAAMAACMNGDVDAILLTGGIAYSDMMTSLIEEKVLFIAPVKRYPGEYEMEGLAGGALRVLNGEEEALSYTGKPVFTGYEAEGFVRLKEE